MAPHLQGAGQSTPPSRVQFHSGLHENEEASMTWTWQLESVDGSALTDPASPAHPSQSDAESWLGEHWRELADTGVVQVTLLDDGTQVYGPMSLGED